MRSGVPRTPRLDLPARGAIVRRIPLVVLNLSAAGCLVESSEMVREGIVGVLEVSVEEQQYSEVIRVCRSTALRGTYQRCRAGAQFLALSAGTERSLRSLAGRVVMTHIESKVLAHSALRAPLARAVAWMMPRAGSGSGGGGEPGPLTGGGAAA